MTVTFRTPPARCHIMVGLVLATSMLLPVDARAGAVYWNSTGTSFTTAGSWGAISGGASGPPSSITDAVFMPHATPGLTQFDPSLSTPANAKTLTLGNTFLGGNWNFTGGGTLTTPAATVRGYGQTTLGVNLTVTGGAGLDVGSDAGLTLGRANVINAAALISNLRGGTLTLDQTGSDTVAATPLSAYSFNSSGANSTINFIGSAGGSTYSFAGSKGGTQFYIGGDTYMSFNQPNAASGATKVSLAAVSQFSGGSLIMQNAGAGVVGSASGPQLTISGHGASTVPMNGDNTGAPWAVIATNSGGVWSGTFAGYGTFGFTPATTTTPVFPSGKLLSYSLNQDLTLTNISTSVSAGALLNINSITINPSAAGQSLNLNTTSLSASGILLNGNQTFNISGGVAAGVMNNISPGTTGSIFVLDPHATLATGLALGAGGTVIKSGLGTLALTGGSDQFGSDTLIVSGGALRVNANSFGTGNVLQLRGGVLETTGSYTFNLPLTPPAGFGVATAGTFNFSAPDAPQQAPYLDAGSGGFSSYTGTLTVAVAGNNSFPLQWNSTPGFLQDGYALLFGSPQSNGTVVFQNPLQLDNNTPGAYTTRDIQVTRGTGGTFDLTNITGAITGSATTDLVKSGTGLLQLSNNNAYAGNTLVEAGTLQANHDHATGGGMVIVATNGTLSGAGLQAGAFIVSGVVSPGQNAAGTLKTAGGLVLMTGSTLVINLQDLATNPVAGTDFGQLAVTANSVTIQTGVRVLLNFLAGAPSAGTYWSTSHTWKSFLTSLNAFSPGAMSIANDQSAWSSLGQFSIAPEADGKNLDLIYSAGAQASPVPEPATLVILLPALPLMRRRAFKRRA